jgi:hypothetical protein
MKRRNAMKKGLLILVLGLVLVFAGAANAAKYADLQGNWTGTWSYAQTDKGASYAGVETDNLSIAINGQDAVGNFYGQATNDTVLSGIAGNISTGKVIIMSWVDQYNRPYAFTGKLKGKTITGVLSVTMADGDWIACGTLTLARP